MLSKGRYIFVLDGLDVTQFQEGDLYGMLRSDSLREFLSYFAASWHSSFCLITSRAPMLDLIDYVTYDHIDVGRLSQNDGISLLRNLGVSGTNEAIAEVVDEWGGHALTLSLLGSCLSDLYEGDINFVYEIPAPTEDEPLYDRVKRVLRRYDEYLSESERAFLKIFSAFRLPVNDSTLRYILMRNDNIGDGYESILGISEKHLHEILEHLIRRRILRYSQKAATYSVHPLIRAHYSSLLLSDFGIAQLIYKRINQFYLKEAKDIPNNPKLDDIAPLIEAIHYACIAGAYDEGYGIIQKNKSLNGQVLINQLSAFETGLSICSEFFQNGDISAEPLVSNSERKASLLNNAGLCLMELGKPYEAVPCFKRSIELDISQKNWLECSISYFNMAESYVYLGSLDAAMNAIENSLDYSRRSGSNLRKINSYAYKAWIAYLNGDLKTAKSDFHQAEVLQRRINQRKPYLLGRASILYAHYLCKIGQLAEARKMAEYCLRYARNKHLLNDISFSHELLGDIDAESQNYEAAKGHYDEAINAARNTSSRPQLIKALISRGRFNAKNLLNTQEAYCALDEALNLAISGNYSIYEADARIAIAWAGLIEGNISTARMEAIRAKQISEHAGYHWGKKDAEDLLQNYVER